MMITLNLKPELEAGLLAQARATGTTPEDYVQHLVERDLSAEVIDNGPSEGTGMVWENGLFIYGAGSTLPAGFVDNAVRRSREERSQHLLGRHD
jgi:hypothetical protein